MLSSGKIYWFVKAAFDAPELRSPQPCSHGSGCNYMRSVDGVSVPGCCGFVHPGEEGTGRRLFPARMIRADNGEEIRQAACVRLTGAAAFYERRRLGVSWGVWCKMKGIPYYPHDLHGERHAPVTIVPITRENAHLVVARSGDKSSSAADEASWEQKKAVSAVEQSHHVKDRRSAQRGREQLRRGMAREHSEMIAEAVVFPPPLSRQRKNEIGEQLYPLVQAQEPELAGRITGMMLESLSEEELMISIESVVARTRSVRAAVDVIQAHDPPRPPRLDLSGMGVDYVAAFGLNRCPGCDIESGHLTACPNSTPERRRSASAGPPPVLRVPPDGLGDSPPSPKRLEFSSA